MRQSQTRSMQGMYGVCKRAKQEAPEEWSNAYVPGILLTPAQDPSIAQIGKSIELSKTRTGCEQRVIVITVKKKQGIQ